MNDKNPNFKKPVEMNYYFEKTQELRFIFEDGDDGENDFIGECTTTLAKIMTKSAGLTVELNKSGRTGRGQLLCRAESMAQSKTHLNFAMDISGMDS